MAKKYNLESSTTSLSWSKPIAELQCWGNKFGGSEHCEDMPLEMTADNLQMTAATHSGNFSIVRQLWPLLTQYANYLVENGLNPQKRLLRRF